MARGNQRDKAREKKEKANKAQVRGSLASSTKNTNQTNAMVCLQLQKDGNSMSGYQMQHANEANADIMRQKQAAADARKAAGGKK
ncbi:hypothetical protein F66182_2932 [Fusarium sp. NRRL 66182]|nr:hypothetical protein F66182_2932 [Fusarium sp. NRRL 66182]